MYILIALVTTKETQVSRQKMQAFLEEFEREFEGKIQESIKRWDFRLAFKNTQTIVKKDFALT